jgi:hypothetical protein
MSGVVPPLPLDTSMVRTGTNLAFIIKITVTVTINLSIELRIFLANMFQVIYVALDAFCAISVQFASFLHNPLAVSSD